MEEFILSLLEPSENDLMIRNEFVSKISRRIDGINGLVNLFLHNMIKHSPRISGDDNLFLKFREIVLAIMGNLNEIIVWNRDLAELLSEVLDTVTKVAGFSIRSLICGLMIAVRLPDIDLTRR